MAAADEQARPADALVSSIVSTPLGKMAKSHSPTKPPGVPQRTPAGGDGTPTLLDRARDAAMADTLTPTGGPSTLESPQPVPLKTTLLARVDASSSRIAAAPELLPLPYTHRLQLVAAGAAAAAGDERPSGEGRSPTVTTAEAVVSDGMEGLMQMVSA